ncbi:hypothetical protein CDAR_602451 [Caerostris darwini]|uniref:Maturase K n=1 Tax=Caerostris darwini TaxID=1538125 RepID=A0AAV4MG58_9ARAC|nr:hypothetical protein CDAR_602451 [Caerostris darwini]
MENTPQALHDPETSSRTPKCCSRSHTPSEIDTGKKISFDSVGISRYMWSWSQFLGHGRTSQERRRKKSESIRNVFISLSEHLFGFLRYTFPASILNKLESRKKWLQNVSQDIWV